MGVEYPVTFADKVAAIVLLLAILAVATVLGIFRSLRRDDSPSTPFSGRAEQ